MRGHAINTALPCPWGAGGCAWSSSNSSPSAGYKRAVSEVLRLGGQLSILKACRTCQGRDSASHTFLKEELALYALTGRTLTGYKRSRWEGCQRRESIHQQLFGVASLDMGSVAACCISAMTKSDPNTTLARLSCNCSLSKLQRRVQDGVALSRTCLDVTSSPIIAGATSQIKTLRQVNTATIHLTRTGLFVQTDTSNSSHLPESTTNRTKTTAAPSPTCPPSPTATATSHPP